MAIDSPLLRQLRQGEKENLRIAAELKQQRLKIKAKIAEIERETGLIRQETTTLLASNAELLASNGELLSLLCEALVSKSKTADPFPTPDTHPVSAFSSYPRRGGGFFCA